MYSTGSTMLKKKKKSAKIGEGIREAESINKSSSTDMDFLRSRKTYFLVIHNINDMKLLALLRLNFRHNFVDIIMIQ